MLAQLEGRYHRGWYGRLCIVVGITGRLIATESIAQLVAGGTAIVGYVLINIRDTGYKQKKLYMRRGVGLKGQLDQASEEPRLFKSFDHRFAPKNLSTNSRRNGP